ncbi:DUF7507 domain-containing protein, partial [Microbacterium karelineae]|uniref:DUF7507 domain-containing protein n=1 Tax=Microbacterium karelineae TaxID=2654283 RepID=UPI0018D494B2
MVSSTPPASNPPMPAQCELDLAMSLDLSNSVDDTQLQQMRDGVAELAESLSEYPVRLALHNFASNAPATTAGSNAPLSLTALDDAGIATVTDWVQGIQRPAAAQGGTNWDRAFSAVESAPEDYDALLFVTDGNPTQYGSPVQGPGNSTDAATITAAVESANSLKATGSRIVGVGLTDNISNMDEFREHMSQISGPAEGSDYLATSFEGLSDVLHELVEANCDLVTPPFESTTPPEPNPPLPPTCALDLAITLDLSNSIGDGQVQAMRDGVAYLGEALSDYPVRLALHNFASFAPATDSAANAPLLLTELDDVGVQAVADWAMGIERPDSTFGNTNWDQAFVAVNEAPDAYDALLFVTDGNPTALGNPPVNNYTVESLTAAVESANALKGEGTRVVGVGLVENLTSDLDIFRSHISQVSGPVEGDDYMLTNFSALADTIIALVEENCADAPSIELIKTANLEDGSTGQVGDTVEYTFTATNTGGQTLTDVVIDDPKAGLSALEYSWPGEPGVLEPGQSVTATATYQVTESDRDVRVIQNSATVSGNPPTGPPVTDEDDADVTLPDDPAIELVKTGALADGDTGAAGDVIEYTFTATNTGNVTLTDVSVSDELEGLSDIAYGAW